MQIAFPPPRIRKLLGLMAASICLAACASIPGQAPPLAAAALPARGTPVDLAGLDIAGVKLGMTAEQVFAALRQSYGQNVPDWRITDQATIDILKISKDMSYPRRVIYFSTHLPRTTGDPMYVNHLFYNIDSAKVGEESIIVDLAKPSDRNDELARVYQVLEITRSAHGAFWQSRGTIFDEVGARTVDKYGAPTSSNAWCAGLVNGQCAADKPYLALYLIDDPVQPVKSVLQLFDPGYGQLGPEAVSATGDFGSLSFERHIMPEAPRPPSHGVQ